MVNRNFNGVQINQSATIVEKAGQNVEDCRNRLFVYDENGNGYFHGRSLLARYL